MYIVWPGLERISYNLAFISESIGGLLILGILGDFWFVLAIASLGFRYIHPIVLRIANRFYLFTFPIIIRARKDFHRHTKR